jgi:hypothetical protein
VEDVAFHCNTIYVAGSGTIGRRTGPIAVVASETGRRVGALPELTGEVGRGGLAEPLVNAMVDDGRGGLFVAGSFAFANDSRCPGIVHVRPSGLLDPRFCPRTNGPVDEVGRHGDTLYLGGRFTSLGGARRDGLAAVTIAGDLLPWSPRLDPAMTCPDRDEPGSPASTVLALAASSSAVYIGGFFSGASGLDRRGLVAVDPSSGTPLVFDADLSAGAEPECDGPSVNRILLTAGRLVAAGDGLPWPAASFVRQLDPLTGAERGARLPSLRVTAMAARGSTLYLGGFFGAAAFELDTGDRLPWRPHIRGDVCCYVPDGGVRAIVPARDSIYLGGNFARVGTTKRAFAARVDARTGEALPWDPSPNGPVLALAALGRDMVLGGGLTSVGVAERHGLIAIDGPSGELLEWAPQAGGTNALAVRGDHLFIGGNLERVNGRRRAGLAAFDLLTGSLTEWEPTISERIYGVTVLATAGDRIYAGGDYGRAASSRSEPSEPRLGVAAFDVRTADLLDWNPLLDQEFDDVHVKGILLEEDAVYVGGDFDSVAGVLRNGAAAVEQGSAHLMPWDPRVGEDVNALAGGPSGVYVGGSFGLVLTDATSGTHIDFPVNVVTPLGVQAVALSRGRVFFAGDFDRVNGAPRAGVAAVDSTTGRLLRFQLRPQDRPRYAPDTIAVRGGAVIVDGYIQGNGEQLVVEPLR